MPGYQLKNTRLTSEHVILKPTALDILYYAHRLSIGGSYSSYDPKLPPRRMGADVIYVHGWELDLLDFVQSSKFSSYHSNFGGYIVFACAYYFPTYYAELVDKLRGEPTTFQRFTERMLSMPIGSLNELFKPTERNQFEMYKAFLRRVNANVND
jgi:hypothetical protein